MTEIVEFVKEVEKYPCIYNHTLPEYSCRSETKRAWEEIAQKFDIHENNCRDKWRKIRIAFSRSLKHMKSGNSSMRPYYLYDHLTFILPFVKANEDHIQPSSPVTSEEDNYEMEINSLQTKTEIFSDSEDGIQRNHHKPTKVFLNEPAFEKHVENKQKIEELKVKKRRREEHIEDNPRKMFLLSLLPDIESLTDDEMRAFRRGAISCIDNIIEERKRMH